MSNFTIQTLGPARHDSPLVEKRRRAPDRYRFTSDGERVPWEIIAREGEARVDDAPSFERAGPRERLYFDPGKVRAGIVTCGGLCPGLNDVIRALVMELHYVYGVAAVRGVRYGFKGLTPDAVCPPVTLTPEDVQDIHRRGGSILGSSRDRLGAAELADGLERLGLDVVFCIGGEGTLAGAHAVAQEVERRGLPIAIVGIPKTIDNDIAMVYRSFGFNTAAAEARKVLDCAHTEAKGWDRGIGLVKLMGRNSGFIAAHATLASGDVNLCLVPEVEYDMESLWGYLRERMNRRRHAVIALAEGVGPNLKGLSEPIGKDKDPGPALKRILVDQFAAWGEPVIIKYIDPSYMIRSVPADSEDSIYCADLARHAAHAGMAGKTDLLVGRWHAVFTHVPLAVVAGRQKTLDPTKDLWRSVLAQTGQPAQTEKSAAAQAAENLTEPLSEGVGQNR